MHIFAKRGFVSYPYSGFIAIFLFCFNGIEVAAQGALVAGQSYRLKARQSHLSLDVRGRSMADGAFVQQYQLDPFVSDTNLVRQQEWRLIAAPGSQNEFYLEAPHSGRLLTVHPDPLGVVQVRPSDDLEERQRWQFETADFAGNIQFYRIRSAWEPFRDYHVDVSGQGIDNEDTVALWTHDWPGNQQMFALRQVSVVTPGSTIRPGRGQWVDICMGICTVTTVRENETTRSSGTVLTEGQRETVSRSL